VGLRHRHMRPKDVRECVEIVRSHALIGPRYGDRIADLHTAWLRVLELDAKTAVVFEEFDGSSARILGMGVSVYVDDAFMRELKTPPFFWIGPELAKRIARGKGPVLSSKELREANSCGGLNLVTWEGCILPQYLKRSEVYNKLMTAFMEEHRGYLWKEIIGSQAESVERLNSTLKSGGMLLNPADGEWSDSQTMGQRDVVKEPHVIGLSRETEQRRPGSLVGMLFDYEPPRFGFNASEQRLLLAALSGGTDEQLSRQLSVSLSAVKKTWRAIYSRVASGAPELIPDNSPPGLRVQDRGREKKQTLIAYLREHPEELRPVSRKFLRKGRATESRLGSY
jgi:hypothetical protein